MQRNDKCKIAKKMGKTNQAFIGKLCIRKDDVVLVVSIKDKKNNLEKLSSQRYLL